MLPKIAFSGKQFSKKTKHVTVSRTRTRARSFLKSVFFKCCGCQSKGHFLENANFIHGVLPKKAFSGKRFWKRFETRYSKSHAHTCELFNTSRKSVFFIKLCGRQSNKAFSGDRLVCIGRAAHKSVFWKTIFQKYLKHVTVSRLRTRARSSYLNSILPSTIWLNLR